MSETLRYVTRLNTLREIEEVIDGKRMFSLPYRQNERESLERRARQIGGAGLKQTLHKLGTVEARARA